MLFAFGWLLDRFDPTRRGGRGGGAAQARGGEAQAEAVEAPVGAAAVSVGGREGSAG
jgi:hypothetical protein